MTTVVAEEIVLADRSIHSTTYKADRRKSEVYLPPEIWDMILTALFECSYHKWSTSTNPCTNWHQPSQLKHLLPLRLVNHDFSHRLTPPLFHDMNARSPHHRQRMVKYFAESRLTPFIHILRLEISPNDLGGKMRRVTQAIHIPPKKKLLHYFEVLPMVVGPLLRHYTRLKTLHLVTTYDGVTDKRLPKSEVLPQCFTALCSSVRKADLPELEDVMLGLPYEGGYTTFFEELQDKRYERGLRNLSKSIRSGSLKLYDSNNTFTTFPFF